MPQQVESLKKPNRSVQLLADLQRIGFSKLEQVILIQARQHDILMSRSQFLQSRLAPGHWKHCPLESNVAGKKFGVNSIHRKLDHAIAISTVAELKNRCLIHKERTDGVPQVTFLGMQRLSIIPGDDIELFAIGQSGREREPVIVSSKQRMGIQSAWSSVRCQYIIGPSSIHYIVLSRTFFPR